LLTADKLEEGPSALHNGRQHPRKKDSGDGDEVNRLCILPVNNMGHIYCTFVGKAQHCLQLLFATLVTVKSSGIDIYSDDYRPFMNALILWGQKSRRAA
jgi:hypothetical protein